jgi:cyclopropane-fatty-acyl-phospholipid synthase
MGTIPERRSSQPNNFWISQPEGKSNFFYGPDGSFTIVSQAGIDPRQYLRLDAYSAATAFVDGKFEVKGDFMAAVRYFSEQPHSGVRQRIFSILARLEHLRIHSLLGTRDEAERNAQFHYDRSNEFYAQFLDSQMVYSAAYFESPDDTLEHAQRQKLQMICRDLVLRPDERFLDIGCGWGGLVVHAAEKFGTKAHGCTLATQQMEWAQSEIAKRRLQSRATVSLCDYRECSGIHDKIASVGMFEHVGKNRLASYFRKMFSLLRPGGLLLNRGIVRPQTIEDGPDTLFVQKAVFPGGELVRLDDVLREGERAGFEAVGLRDLRTHYGLTCRAWVKNLQRNAIRCRSLVGDRTYRTWVLYLAASAVSFEEARTSAAQVLFLKPRD